MLSISLVFWQLCNWCDHYYPWRACILARHGRCDPGLGMRALHTDQKWYPALYCAVNVDQLLPGLYLEVAEGYSGRFRHAACSRPREFFLICGPPFLSFSSFSWTFGPLCHLKIQSCSRRKMYFMLVIWHGKESHIIALANMSVCLEYCYCKYHMQLD